MTSAFPNGNGIFQKDNVPCQKARIGVSRPLVYRIQSMVSGTVRGQFKSSCPKQQSRSSGVISTINTAVIKVVTQEFNTRWQHSLLVNYAFIP
ncbi:hypothetical protein TNCV_2148211 [Trichonephila clavipes]|uniref:Uncharacterized protein n=1 Tax=Trichonephila clavipes TaxID=2585209 RepID=A0A8X6SYT1_TRICX|nr:hypothetical protein TNCV_2148211 [Trichonephila clavipes]